MWVGGGYKGSFFECIRVTDVLWGLPCGECRMVLVTKAASDVTPPNLLGGSEGEAQLPKASPPVICGQSPREALQCTRFGFFHSCAHQSSSALCSGMDFLVLECFPPALTSYNRPGAGTGQSASCKFSYTVHTQKAHSWCAALVKTEAPFTFSALSGVFQC